MYPITYVLMVDTIMDQNYNVGRRYALSAVRADSEMNSTFVLSLQVKYIAKFVRNVEQQN